MPSWTEVIAEIAAEGGGYDNVRRKYLKLLSEHTTRNVIAYYSGWLQKDQIARKGEFDFGINDDDITGFMSCVYSMDKSIGLDLILHTPGGEMGATESIVNYLRSRFNKDIRAIIPQLAMSAGTIIALACKEIVMGAHSSLGPYDPQVFGLSAHGVVEEFEKACKDAKETPNLIPIWQPIIARYMPTLVGECDKASRLADTLVTGWLSDAMFADKRESEKRKLIKKVTEEMGLHSTTLYHNRHIALDKAMEIGLKVVELEKFDPLQDLVLSVHHAFILTFSGTAAVKIIENQSGRAYVRQIRQGVIAMPGK